MPSIPPKARLATITIAAAGVFVAGNWLPLLIALLVVVGLLIRAGLLRTFLTFFFTMLGPAALMLVLIWGLVTRAPPGAAMGSDPRGGAISRGLVELYAYIQTRLIEANSRQIDPPLAEVEQLLGVLQEAWRAVPGAPATTAPDADAEHDPVSCNY